MDFKDTIVQLAERIAKQKEAIITEEATKTAFVMPLISSLGYDVFNPFEVVPELDCDLIKKKGEKIDYAIMKDEEPILLIECKHCKQDLNLHDTQLKKYFVASKARFGVLTNGIEYRFYTDLDNQNIMDEKPFLVVNLLEVQDGDIEQLKKFHKSYYNESDILSTANELKYTTEIKNLFVKEFATPSPDFVRYFTKQAYTSGQITQKVIDQFSPIVKRSIHSVINDIISERLNNAIKADGNSDKMNAVAEIAIQVPELETLPEGVIFLDKESGVTTTQEEIDAFNIVKSILRKDIDVSRIQFRDFKTYFSIYVDSQSKWICRIYFNSRKFISFPTVKEGFRNNEEKVEIETLDHIFNYADELTSALNIRINPELVQSQQTNQ
ncbi:MAG: type I restriction endonuclease [Tannerellaceae bacterium]